MDTLKNIRGKMDETTKYGVENNNTYPPDAVK